MIAKLECTQCKSQQNRTSTESRSGSNNEQINNRTTTLEQTAAKANRGLNKRHFKIIDFLALNCYLVDKYTLLFNT